jgi:type I restriction enzyme, S subunit
MGVRPEYKKTNAGIIPEEWEAVQFGSLFTFKNGLNKEKQFFGKGTPIVNYMDVFGRPGLKNRDLRGRVTLSKTEIDRFNVRKGDVFFTRTSETTEEIGISAVMLDSPKETVFSGFILRARPLDNSLEDEFKQFCFANSSVRSQIVSTSTYTTRALTNGRLLSNVWLALPPKNEQLAIAIALSDVDALLDGLDRLIAKKRDINQAAMQQLLTGKTRLPGFEGEWQTKKLGDIAVCYSGGTPATYVLRYYCGDIPWITSSDLNKVYISDVGGRISQEGLKNSSAKMIEPDTLLIALYGATAGVAALSKIGAAINQAVLAIVPNEDDNGFLFYKLKLLKNWLISTFTQGGQPNLSGDIVKSVKLSFPSIPEQTAIATILSDMDAEIEALEKRRAKTRDLKKAMMQELLTGRTRLV